MNDKGVESDPVLIDANKYIVFEPIDFWDGLLINRVVDGSLCLVECRNICWYGGGCVGTVAF